MRSALLQLSGAVYAWRRPGLSGVVAGDSSLETARPAGPACKVSLETNGPRTSRRGKEGNPFIGGMTHFLGRKGPIGIGHGPVFQFFPRPSRVDRAISLSGPGFIPIGLCIRGSGGFCL